MALIIKTNGGTVADVLIPDVGVLITQAGGSETFSDSDEIMELQISNDLRVLTTDDAFGAGSSTLILNDGTNDIDQTDAANYLETVLLPKSDQDFGVMVNNAAGLVDLTVVFDGTATITGIPDPVLAGDVANKQYVDAVASGGRTFKELVLSETQLDSANDAISQAIVFWAANNPVANDTLIVTDGTTTETFSFVAAAAVPFEVTIGATPADTMVNLATAITTDSTLWEASTNTELLDFNPTVVVIQRANQALDSYDDRIYGVWTTQTDAQVGSFTGVNDYTYTNVAALAAVDSGVKDFGFGRSTASLIPNETHVVRDLDVFYTWDSDTGTWQNTGTNNPLLQDSRYVGKWLQFGVSRRVPPKGTRYLESPGRVKTSSVGTILLRAGKITGATINVNTADGSRDYKLSLIINGVEVAILALPAGTTQASISSLAVNYGVGDVLKVAVIKTSNNGSSSFGNISATIEINESL